jgi:hypothetical protein
MATPSPLVHVLKESIKAVQANGDELSDTNGSPPGQIAMRLAEPFDPCELRWKPGAISGSRALAVAYLDARAVQARLDEVLGLDGWQDDYRCLPDGSVVCRLRLRINGKWITKVDVGGPSEQPDGGDRLKAAFSDALKRAAVKFGIGRYLYRLPTQWADWDPQRKQFVKMPSLPPWALPGGLTFEQEATLIGLIGATGSDLAKFLGHFRAKRLVDLTTEQYDAALRMLRTKAKNAK